MPYFRKTSPSVALTGKDSQNERISIASRSFIFWPIGKIRLQKKVGSKKVGSKVIFSDFKISRFQISKILLLKCNFFHFPPFFKILEKSYISRVIFLKSEIWKFWNLKSENFDPTFFWGRIFPIGQKINNRLVMEIRSFLESFPVRATEGEVFLKYGMGTK